MKRENLVLAAAAGMLLLFALAVYVSKQQRQSSLDSTAQQHASNLIREHSPTLGPAEAKVKLVEFTDPACETCAAFYPFTKELMAAHPGKIQLVLRYAPFHAGSDRVVKMLVAAGRQGKYWETLQLMFATQQMWASHHHPQPERLWELLPQVGLDLERLRNDMNDPALDRILEQDVADARALQVTKTPGFFVNGKPLVSFGYEQLRQLVDSEVRAAYPQ